MPPITYTARICPKKCSNATLRGPTRSRGTRGTAEQKRAARWIAEHLFVRGWNGLRQGPRGRRHPFRQLAARPQAPCLGEREMGPHAGRGPRSARHRRRRLIRGVEEVATARTRPPDNLPARGKPFNKFRYGSSHQTRGHDVLDLWHRARRTDRRIRSGGASTKSSMSARKRRRRRRVLVLDEAHDLKHSDVSDTGVN